MSDRKLTAYDKEEQVLDLFDEFCDEIANLDIYDVSEFKRELKKANAIPYKD